MGLCRWVRPEWTMAVLVCGSSVCGFGAMAVTTAGAQQVAFTFDDLPAHGPLPPGETRMAVAEKVLKALKKAHMPPVYGFVNGVAVEEHPETAAVLAVWRAAGDPLGNHTWSHMNLNQHSLEQFEEDTQKNEALLELQMKGMDWKWLRYPFLAEGDTAAKKMGGPGVSGGAWVPDRGGDDELRGLRVERAVCAVRDEARWEGDSVAGAQLFAGGG
jgi:peptidoglycan/xylan/chitin deacetylase (PgdA/CDA1 family)